MMISIFTDELFCDTDKALPKIVQWHCKYVDLRGNINGKGIEYQTEEELIALKAQLDTFGLKVGALETSLCKVHLPGTDICAKEEEKLEGIIRAANILGCRLVRAFNYWQPYGDNAEVQGQLAVRPDLMNQVLRLFSPIAKRAKEAGLILAFENCGQTYEEVIALVDALGIPEWGMAWDVYNDMHYFKSGSAEEYEYFLKSLLYARIVHVKAVSALSELEGTKVPWERVLRGVKAVGRVIPVSIETHNPEGSPFSHEESTYRTYTHICKNWPEETMGTVENAIKEIKSFPRTYREDPVRFVVVGLGMGSFRAQQIVETEGCELYGVVDIKEDKAKKIGEKLGAKYSTDINDFLQDDKVEVMYTVVPTGLHAQVSEQCLRAGKHVLTTKPMDVNTANCKRLIKTAKETGCLLGVDFDMRMDEVTLSLKKALDEGWFGHLLSAQVSLYVTRTQEYYDENGAWRGTWKMDGGGAMCNQGIHEIDRMQYLLGMPKRVRAMMQTQMHAIETEDIGYGEWDYGSQLSVRYFSTTNYPVPSWYTKIDLIGSAGAFVYSSGGPEGEQIRYGKKDKWYCKAPFPEKRKWRQASDAFASAIRLGTPFIAEPEEGIKSRIILDAMYSSAKNGGIWIDIETLV